MTPKQLAEHWQISESEANNISGFINKFYELDVIPVNEGNQTFWQGVMYAYDPRNKYILMESDDKFISRDQAVLHWTNYVHQYQIPEGQAQQMRFGQGVPTDVFLALKPVDGYGRIMQQMQLSVKLNPFSKQYN